MVLYLSFSATPRTKSGGVVYVSIIVVLSVLVFVCLLIIIRVILCWREEKYRRHAAELRRDGNISNASEAPCLGKATHLHLRISRFSLLHMFVC